MCAWKRGTQNNLPGVIRKGHIKEFLIQQSAKDDNISASLKAIEAEVLPVHIKDRYINCGHASICTSENGLPDCFLPFVVDNVLYLHAHEYPRCVVTAVLNIDVPFASIILNETHRVNSKVCSGDLQNWTVFQGDKFMYDCREGAIGDTGVRVTGKAPSILHRLVLEIKPYSMDTIVDDVTDRTSSHVIDCAQLISAFSKSLLNCIVTTEEIYVVSVNGIQYVGRVHELCPDVSEDSDDEGELSYALRDDYRGMVDEYTAIYLLPDKTLPLRSEDGSIISSTSNNCSCVFDFHLNPSIPPRSELRDTVTIRTSDEEEFPVKRKLLRPCLSLTAVVQAGKGKYKVDISKSMESDHNTSVAEEKVEETQESAYVDVDACTFDRVLLYLEHAARGEQFRFDPLLASDLLEAATTLKIAGLVEVCERVLGSFQERVRTTPIRLDEVFRRNLAGAVTPDATIETNTDSTCVNKAKHGRKRSETLLLMSGMVFDITRWLDEHPGGSTIIPEQALNVDCTVFFEIYHASRQSFLYLKEFYIGELALADRDSVPLPRGYAAKTMSATAGTAMEGRASDAFIDQLNRITGSWRLDVHKMAAFESYKSF